MTGASGLPRTFQLRSGGAGGNGGEGVGEGNGVGVGVGVGLGVGVGVGLGVGVGVEVGVGAGVRVGLGVGVGVEVDVGTGVGAGIGVGDDAGVGDGKAVAVGEGLGIFVGVGAAVVAGSGVELGARVGSGWVQALTTMSAALIREASPVSQSTDINLPVTNTTLSPAWDIRVSLVVRVGKHGAGYQVLTLGMRTTLNIDDDVLSVARALTQRKKISLGSAVSELARRGFRGVNNISVESNLPGFTVAADAEPITSEDVYRALEDWP